MLYQRNFKYGHDSDDAIRLFRNASVLGRRFRWGHVPGGLNRRQRRYENHTFHVSALIGQTRWHRTPEDSNLKVTECTFSSLHSVRSASTLRCRGTECTFSSLHLVRSASTLRCRGTECTFSSLSPIRFYLAV
jgi:hypothetical protein